MSEWMRMRGLYFDRQGRSIDVERWSVLHDDDEYVRVGLDVHPSLEDDVASVEPLATVSTVWLGINHGFMSPAPVIFETMIFGGVYDDAVTRYSTEADALRGHQQTVDDLHHGRVPWFMTEDREAVE